MATSAFRLRCRNFAQSPAKEASISTLVNTLFSSSFGASTTCLPSSTTGAAIPSSLIPSWLTTSILVSSSFSTSGGISSCFTSSSFLITGGVNFVISTLGGGGVFGGGGGGGGGASVSFTCAITTSLTVTSLLFLLLN